MLEKAPFFALSLIFGLVAIFTQQDAEALPGAREIDFFESLAVSGFSLCVYLFKSIFSVHLSAFHPYPVPPGAPLPWYFYTAGLGLIFFAALVFKRIIRDRRIVFGLGFFLVSIAPVLQFLPVGHALHAERYTYIAYLGLFYLIAVGIEIIFKQNKPVSSKHLISTGLKRGANESVELHTRFFSPLRLFSIFQEAPIRQKLLLAGLMLWLVALTVITFKRGGVWQNGETLWTDVIAKYPSDFFAYGARASYFKETGKFDRALADYSQSLNLQPLFFEGRNNRGLIYLQKNEYQAARADFDKAIELKPNFAGAYANRGLVALNTGDYDQALADFDRAVALNPDSPIFFYNRGLAHQRVNKPNEALADFDKAVLLDPAQPQFYKDRGFTYGLLSQYEKALQDFTRALQLDPSYAEAYFWRAAAYRDLKRLDPALRDALKARELGYPVSDDFLQSLRH